MAVEKVKKYEIVIFSDESSRIYKSKIIKCTIMIQQNIVKLLLLLLLWLLLLLLPTGRIKLILIHRGQQPFAVSR